MQAGNTVDVLEAPHTGKASVGNQLQKKIFLAYGGKILTEFPEGKSYTLVIDAVFGVGLSQQCGGRIRIVNRPDECHGRGEGGRLTLLPAFRRTMEMCWEPLSGQI